MRLRAPDSVSILVAIVIKGMYLENSSAIKPDIAMAALPRNRLACRTGARPEGALRDRLPDTYPP